MLLLLMAQGDVAPLHVWNVCQARGGREGGGREGERELRSVSVKTQAPHAEGMTLTAQVQKRCLLHTQTVSWRGVAATACIAEQIYHSFLVVKR